MSFLSTLFNSIHAEKSGYEWEFKESYARTRKWKLTPPPFNPQAGRLLTKDMMARIQECWINQLPGFSYEDFSQQCFLITGLLQEPLQKVLGVPLFYTLGFVQEKGKGPIFHTELAELKQLADGMQISTQINLHAWLTLPTYEVLDFTLLTTMGMVLGVPDKMARAIAGHPEQFPGQPSYHPQLIGDEFLQKIGLLHRFN